MAIPLNSILDDTHTVWELSSDGKLITVAYLNEEVKVVDTSLFSPSDLKILKSRATATGRWSLKGHEKLTPTIKPTPKTHIFIPPCNPASIEDIGVVGMKTEVMQMLRDWPAPKPRTKNNDGVTPSSDFQDQVDYIEEVAARSEMQLLMWNLHRTRLLLQHVQAHVKSLEAPFMCLWLGIGKQGCIEHFLASDPVLLTDADLLPPPPASPESLVEQEFFV